MLAIARRLARRWVSQDVARANAAQASIRLSTIRREREAVDAYLRQGAQPYVRQTARGGRRMQPALRVYLRH